MVSPINACSVANFCYVAFIGYIACDSKMPQTEKRGNIPHG